MLLPVEIGRAMFSSDEKAIEPDPLTIHVFLGPELLFEMSHKGMVFNAQMTCSIINSFRPLFVFTTKFAWLI